MQQKKRRNTPPLIYLYKDLYYFFFLAELTARVISGSASPRTHSAVIFMPTISSSDGASNMSFVSIFSTIALSPLAPVFSSIVLLAISRFASSVISKSMLSSLKSFVYCLISEFFGSVSILQSASSSSSLSLHDALPIYRKSVV